VRAILRATAADAGGQVVEARADEFFAVFESPQAALATALAIQHALKDKAFVDGVRVRVRIGIHSGYPTQTDANYIGLPVHITARICGAAHGGQIVVSGDTRLAVKGARPEGVRFRVLGQHRLRGIPGQIALFQVAAKGLAARFPPPRT
jgi:class 3 adenylate cyclase